MSPRGDDWTLSGDRTMDANLKIMLIAISVVVFATAGIIWGMVEGAAGGYVRGKLTKLAFVTGIVVAITQASSSGLLLLVYPLIFGPVGLLADLVASSRRPPNGRG